MHPLLQTQEELHNEASSLLQNILLPLLEPYGTVSVGGSYSYKLLHYPDLDIDVVSLYTAKDVFSHLCGELIKLDCTTKFKSADRVQYPHTHPGKRPFGYWLAPEINFGNHTWNVDIWLQKPEWHTDATNQYADELRNLSEEARITILSLKNQLREKNLYGVGKEFSSVDVYVGVLRGNIKTIEELRGFVAGSHNLP